MAKVEVRKCGNKDSGAKCVEAGKDWRGVRGGSGQCSDASKDWPGVVERRTGQARGADGKDLEMGSHLLLASLHSFTISSSIVIISHPLLSYVIINVL